MKVGRIRQTIVLIQKPCDPKSSSEVDGRYSSKMALVTLAIAQPTTLASSRISLVSHRTGASQQLKPRNIGSASNSLTLMIYIHRGVCKRTLWKDQVVIVVVLLYFPLSLYSGIRPAGLTDNWDGSIDGDTLYKDEGPMVVVYHSSWIIRSKNKSDTSIHCFIMLYLDTTCSN